MRLRRGLGFQPVENVRGLERTWLRQTVGGSVAGACGDCLFALVNRVDVRRAGPRRVQREATEKSEAVQHLRVRGARDQVSDALTVNLLVQIQPGLLAAQQVHSKLQSVQLDRQFAVEFSRNDTVSVGKTLEFARRDVVALNHSARRKDLLESGDDHRFTLVHAERRGLQHQHILVFVHDESAEKIALGIDHSEGSGFRQMLFPHLQRCANALLEKRFIHGDPLRREHPDVDFRFRIVETDAEQTLAMVFDLDKLAVSGRLRKPQDGALINPRMPRHHAVGFSRLQ